MSQETRSKANVEDNQVETEAKVKVKITQAVPFFAVSDMERSVRYYVDGLGFEMTNRWVVDGKLRWCWLQHGGAALMLQEFRKEGLNSWIPGGNVGEGVSINFQCDDAIAFYREVIGRGISAKRPSVGNGLWVTGLADPDGYQLFFASPTDAAEETKCTE